MEPFYFGLGITLLASAFQGSFVVPMTYAKGWKWENSWLLFSILGMLLFNWMLAVMSVPDLGAIYAKATPYQLMIPIIFGFLWGIGSICFGLGMAVMGLALGYTIIMGLVLGMGAFIPMLCLYPGDIMTFKGLLILAGLVVMLVGICLSGIAGRIKEREQGGRSGEITKTTNISTGVGFLICLVAGVFSSFSNVGYALSEPLIHLAQEQGASSQWAGNAVWVLILSTGGVVNIVYSIFLLVRNKTFGIYKQAGFSRNIVLIACMALMWIGSFSLYGLGANQMGQWGTVIGWSIFIALSIAIGTLWGIFQGEWAGTKFQSRRIMCISFAILVLAILIFAWSTQVA